MSVSVVDAACSGRYGLMRWRRAVRVIVPPSLVPVRAVVQPAPSPPNRVVCDDHPRPVSVFVPLPCFFVVQERPFDPFPERSLVQAIPSSDRVTWPLPATVAERFGPVALPSVDQVTPSSVLE